MACEVRDAHADIAALGARVYGVSTQDTAYQREFIRRFHLPFPLLSHAKLELARALGLPSVAFGGETLLRRLTLIADPQGVVRKVLDAIADPGSHAQEVLAFLKGGGVGRLRCRGPSRRRSARCCRASTARSCPTSRTWAA